MAGNADCEGSPSSGHHLSQSRRKQSKYLAYENPSKSAIEQQNASRKRIFEKAKEDKMKNQSISDEEALERQQHEKLIGQLKAAEARNRIRVTRLRYESTRADEISQLVASQPSAAMAVRLQALLPVKKDNNNVDDSLNKMSRERIERILNDNLGLTTGRT